MKILYFEGTGNFEGRLVQELLKDVVHVSNIEDGLYNLIYTETEYDIVMIGDELNDRQDFTEHLVEEMHSLNGCKYFPVDFGKICIELCKKNGKKAPKIVIFTTLYFYFFEQDYVCDYKTFEKIKEYIAGNNMQLIDKASEDFCSELQNLKV